MFTKTALSVRVELPEAVAAAYLKQADEAGRTFEEEVARRLVKCSDYLAIKPIYLDDAQRGELESTFGKNFNSPEMLVKSVQNLARVRVGGMIVDLSEGLLTRLGTRAIGMSLKDLIRKEIIAALERFVGLR